MISSTEFKKEVLLPILKAYHNDMSRHNGFCAIWAIDSFATHVAIERDKSSKSPVTIEKEFKKELSKKCWQFRVIREASNATKHAVRKANAKDVQASHDVRHDGGMNMAAYCSYSNGGVIIDLDWEFDTKLNNFVEPVTRAEIPGCTAFLKSVFLDTLIDPAVDSIERAAYSTP